MIYDPFTKIREQRVKAVDVILSFVSEESQSLLDTYIKQHTDHWYFRFHEDSTRRIEQ